MADIRGESWPKRFHIPASSTPLNVYAAPRADAALVRRLLPGADVVVHGASPCGDWLRLTPARAADDEDALWVRHRQHRVDEACDQFVV